MKNLRKLFCALGALAAFALWTALICHVDVHPIGPNGSSVGLAALNAFFHRLTDVHMEIYVLTDWLSLIPVGFALGFAVLGLIQWIRRKSLFKVDGSILALGGFYMLVLVSYLFFERFVINYRPVLIDGFLEASYPSSTTLLVLCIMPTTMIQFKNRIGSPVVRKGILAILAVFTVFMTVGRLISGVHWLTDIIGGVLLSAGLVEAYAFAADCLT